MTGNRNSTAQDWTDDEDAPDLSTPEWQDKLARVAVRRGRPRSARPKVSTTIRLDADVLAYFRASGPGWQSRVNALLRAAMR
jgi:uncharacterized protein (DUF4415 family)